MALFDENKSRLKKLKKIADKVDALAPVYKEMSDDELKAMTPKFKEKLANGAKLDDILPDAFAVAREAADRVLGLRPFFVQIMGAIALHQGRIAEMATGEGKTLVATMPAYLNALEGKGVHVVTVNDYLTVRDANWMGKLYKFLGLTVGIIVPQMHPAIKQAQYACDITYCTNNELGFDFLRDNMITDKRYKLQRELNFAIVDEVDSILIDEARTPLIISGKGDKSNDLYKQADRFAKRCKSFVLNDPDGGFMKKQEEIPENVDFTINEKQRTVMLTDKGVKEAEAFFHVENLTDIENIDLNNHIQQALKANYIMKRDINYIVNEGEVLIVDEFTGRVMIGRRFSEGLHQAIEAKEGVNIREENQTVATITFQNFFRMYTKLSGMTGTAKTEEDEFKDIYALDVVTIPPNKPSQRFDDQDQIYSTRAAKITAIVQDIIDHHAKGQPILVGTVSVEKSENLSAILNRKGIWHQVLNAKNHKKESEIIAQAGRLNAVTIATNMAGRGTDIMLGGNPEYQARQKMEKDGYPLELIEKAISPLKSDDPEVIKAKAEFKHHYDAFKANCDAEKEKVIEAGGLHIIGTERHESRRIDNQLRGRAGRQGDPGSSVFFISLDDDIARIFGGERLKSIVSMFDLPEDQPIANKMITKQIEKAQRLVEGRNYAARKQVLSYDDVINAQREVIYKERAKVLDGLDVHDQILDMIDDLAEDIISKYANYKVDYQTWDYDAFNAELENRMLPKGSNVMTIELCSCFDVYKLKDAVMKIALADYEAKEEDAKENGVDWRAVERTVLLKTVDAKWIDHIESMDALRRGIGLRGLGQRDPIIAYRQEGWDMFDDMVNSIHVNTAEILMRAEYVSAQLGAKRERAERAQRAQNVAISKGNTKSFVKNKKH